ncbi:MAG: HAD family hydrolase [Stackebrandtia sp.]
MIRAVIFDLDGVVRHFDPAAVEEVERRHGLARGAVFEAAFSQPLLTDVTTGRSTRAQWVGAVGEQLGAPAAAVEWSALPAAVDPAMLLLSDELRGKGLATAILTNGTDTIPAEVAESGIAPHFDAVYNSAEIGFAKPDVRVFKYVLDELKVDAEHAFFTDDSPSKLTGAEALGMVTHHFTGVDALRRALADAGVRA